MNIKNLFVIIFLVLTTGCAGSFGPNMSQTSNAKALSAGESHINTMAGLSVALQKAKFCHTEKYKYEYGSDVSTPINMHVSDDTGRVAWFYDSSTGIRTDCAIEAPKARAVAVKRLN